MMKRTILLFILLLSNACSEQPGLHKLSGETVILAFGDSLTYGTGSSKQHDYPSTLANLSKLDVINAGVPGEISEEGAKRLPELLDQHQPELLVLMHGGNDFLRKISPEVTQANLNNMIMSAKQRNIPVILLGIPQPGLFFLNSATLYQTLATEHNIPVDLDTVPYILSHNHLKSDLIHPNDAGYNILATNIFNILKSKGAL